MNPHEPSVTKEDENVIPVCTGNPRFSVSSTRQVQLSPALNLIQERNDGKEHFKVKKIIERI